MPMGISFCGLIDSWATVETASKPIYAKKTTAAPRTIPLQPYSPGPRLGGMKAAVGLLGVTQFEALTNQAPARMKITITRSFTATIALFTLADSLIPITRRIETKTIIKTAG